MVNPRSFWFSVVLALSALAPAGTRADTPRAVSRADVSRVRVAIVHAPGNGELGVLELQTAVGGPRLSDVGGTFGGGVISAFAAGRNAWRVLVALPTASRKRHAELDVRLKFDDGVSVRLREKVAVRRVRYETRTLNVPKKYVAPPRSELKRIRQEKAALKRVLRTYSTTRYWRGSFLKPTATPETSPFGALRTYNNKRSSRHFGWDLDGAVGDPILATAAGRVVYADDRYYSGGTVVIDHGRALFSMYFHMSKIDVKVGQVLDAGSRIGDVGQSGRVTGPHLHFAVKLGQTYVSPKALLALPLHEPAP